jgi:hypothetical protein
MGHRRVWLIATVTLLAGAGCGDNQGTTGTAGMGGTTTTTTSQGGGGSSGTTTDTTTGGGTGGSGGTGGASECAPPDVLSVLQEYLDDLHLSADLLATHPSAVEAVGFFHAPGLPQPPANGASFYSLFMVCSGPVLYDPYCDQGLCSQLECTSNDASWANHLSIDSPPQTHGDFTYLNATIDIAWMDGATGIAFGTMTESTGANATNWSLSGTGTMDTMGVTLQADFPALFPRGSATLTYEGGMNAFSGGIVIGEVLIAEVDASGKLVATGFCP